MGRTGLPPKVNVLFIRGACFCDQPRPIRGGQTDQGALQIVTAPASQQNRSVLVLHPLGNSLEAKAPRQIDQRMHESTVVTRLYDVWHEGTVDFHDVDA